MREAEKETEKEKEEEEKNSSEPMLTFSSRRRTANSESDRTTRPNEKKTQTGRGPTLAQHTRTGEQARELELSIATFLFQFSLSSRSIRAALSSSQPCPLLSGGSAP